MTQLWDKFLLDAILAALTLVLFNGALTGKFYTHGRGGPPKLIWTVKGGLPRLLLLLAAVLLCTYLVLDLHKKLT